VEQCFQCSDGGKKKSLPNKNSKPAKPSIQGDQKADLPSDTETHLPRTSSRVLTPIIRLCIILTHSPFSRGSRTPPQRRPPPGKRPRSRDQNLLSQWSSNFNHSASSTKHRRIYNARDLDSIPGLGRSPGEGNGYSLQYSGLQNSMDCIE